MNKKFLTIGALVTAAIPTAAISCGSKDDANDFINFEKPQRNTSSIKEEVLLPDGSTSTSADLETACRTLTKNRTWSVRHVELEAADVAYATPIDITNSLLKGFYSNLGFVTSEYSIEYKGTINKFFSSVDFAKVLNIDELNALKIRKDESEKSMHDKLQKWIYKCIYRFDNNQADIYKKLVKTQAYKNFVHDVPANKHIVLLTGDSDKDIDDLPLNATDEQIDTFFAKITQDIPYYIENKNNF